MTKEPRWMSYQAVVLLHDMELSRHFGLPGIRDKSLLISAIEQPKHYYHYTNPLPSIPELAAVYAYGIAMNHAFCDANKRTAFGTSVAFLDINKFELVAQSTEIYITFRALGAGDISRERLIKWFITNSIIRA